MEMSNTEVLMLIGYVGATGVQTWLLVRYLIDRMDKKANEVYIQMGKEREERLQSEAMIRANVDGIRDTHVRREDYLHHVNAMSTQITDLRNSITSRLDAVISALGGVPPNGK